MTTREFSADLPGRYPLQSTPRRPICQSLAPGSPPSPSSLPRLLSAARVDPPVARDEADSGFYEQHAVSLGSDALGANGSIRCVYSEPLTAGPTLRDGGCFLHAVDKRTNERQELVPADPESVSSLDKRILALRRVLGATVQAVFGATQDGWNRFVRCGEASTTTTTDATLTVNSSGCPELPPCTSVADMATYLRLFQSYKAWLTVPMISVVATVYRTSLVVFSWSCGVLEVQRFDPDHSVQIDPLVTDVLDVEPSLRASPIIIFNDGDTAYEAEPPSTWPVECSRLIRSFDAALRDVPKYPATKVLFEVDPDLQHAIKASLEDSSSGHPMHPLAALDVAKRQSTSYPLLAETPFRGGSGRSRRKSRHPTRPRSNGVDPDISDTLRPPRNPESKEADLDDLAFDRCFEFFRPAVEMLRTLDDVSKAHIPVALGLLFHRIACAAEQVKEDAARDSLVDELLAWVRTWFALDLPLTQAQMRANFHRFSLLYHRRRRLAVPETLTSTTDAQPVDSRGRTAASGSYVLRATTLSLISSFRTKPEGFLSVHAGAKLDAVDSNFQSFAKTVSTRILSNAERVDVLTFSKAAPHETVQSHHVDYVVRGQISRACFLEVQVGTIDRDGQEPGVTVRAGVTDSSVVCAMRVRMRKAPDALVDALNAASFKKLFGSDIFAAFGAKVTHAKSVKTQRAQQNRLLNGLLGLSQFQVGRRFDKISAEQPNFIDDDLGEFCRAVRPFLDALATYT